MSTLSTTPALVLTSPSDESLLTSKGISSTISTELHDIDLHGAPPILIPRAASPLTLEFSSNTAERRPKSRSTTPQPPLHRGIGGDAKPDTKPTGSVAVESFQQQTSGDLSRQGPGPSDGDARDYDGSSWS